MAYLLSVLSPESPVKNSNDVLCYYINDTADIQIIRVINGSNYDLERIVFSGERILFAAALESYLEVHSSLENSTRFRKIACRLLHVNYNSNFEQSVS